MNIRSMFTRGRAAIVESKSIFNTSGDRTGTYHFRLLNFIPHTEFNHRQARFVVRYILKFEILYENLFFLFLVNIYTFFSHRGYHFTSYIFIKHLECVAGGLVQLRQKIRKHGRQDGLRL